VNDRTIGVSVEVIHGGEKALLELPLGRDMDMAQHRTGELGGESLDDVQPGAMLGSKSEVEPVDRLLASQARVSLEMCAE